MTTRTRKARSGRQGATMVEFLLVSVQLCLLMLAAFEFGRMVLIYTNVANAARIGVRYAITHGSSRIGAAGTTDGPATAAQIEAMVRDYARSGLVDTSRVIVTVAWPTNKEPGTPVSVTVTYQYDPFLVAAFGAVLNVNMGTTTKGYITY